MTALVIEDEPLVMGVLQTILQIDGFIVLAADTAETALRYCCDPGIGIDLVIVDRLLSGIFGTDVALQIVAIRPDVLFTSCTPLDLWDTKDLRNVSILPKESHAFLQKPFTAQKMMAVVEELMSRRPALAVAALQA
jgi:DNA-binding response OmpR family regulator